MEEKLEYQRFGAFITEYQKRKQRTDKEVIQDLTECIDEDSCEEFDQGLFSIEPFEKKEEYHEPVFDTEGHLVLQKFEAEKEDLILDRVEKVIIDPFSLTNEIKHCKFDPNGNFIPVEENLEEEEEEEETNEDEPPIEFDRIIAIDSLKYIISLMTHNETVSQTFIRFKKDQETISELTTAVCQVQFMGLDNIYEMKRKEIGKEYNQLLQESNQF